MDPNITLETLRRLSAKLVEDYQNDGNGIDQDEAYAMAEAFENLDKWIKQGGFLPERWDPKTLNGS